MATYTEAEAKTKACFRAATFAGSQQIADGPGPNCIASGCMAWRWQKEYVNKKTGLPVSGPNLAVDAEWRPTGLGFCGLAHPP